MSPVEQIITNAPLVRWDLFIARLIVIILNWDRGSSIQDLKTTLSLECMCTPGMHVPAVLGCEAPLPLYVRMYAFPVRKQGSIVRAQMQDFKDGTNTGRMTAVCIIDLNEVWVAFGK